MKRHLKKLKKITGTFSSIHIDVGYTANPCCSLLLEKEAGGVLDRGN
jgi:hypothetical protein